MRQYVEKDHICALRAGDVAQVKTTTATTTSIYRPLFQDNLGKPVPER